MKITAFKLVTTSVLLAALTACGGGGGGGVAALPDTPSSTSLTVTGTAATGLAIAGATVTGKCKVGTGTATTLANGTFTLTVTDGQLPCVLQITNPADGTKLHTLVFGAGNTAVANITPLTEMTTARVLGSEPNVFFAAFDAAVATQKVTTANVATAQTAIDLIFTGTIDTTPVGDFITTPLVVATQGSPTSGDAQDKLLDALKLKLTTAQLGTVTTALASNQTIDVIKQAVISLSTEPSAPPVANAGTAQNVMTGSTVTLDASTSSAAAGKTLTYVWTLTSKPTGSSATLAAANSAMPTFVADVAGTYVAKLIVNDGTTDSSASAITVIASVANAAPVANAGVSQNVVAGSVVTLDGGASSDANSDPLTFAWTLTSKPVGSLAVLSSPTSTKPTFNADMAGTYVASLTVNDSKVSSTVAVVLTTAWTPGFSNSQDGTVIDPATGLIWMRCLMGQAWNGTTCTGTASTYNFDQANALTGTLTFAGQRDWRLPNIRELQTIVDRSVYGPAIDAKTFPISSNDYHWTSSVGANDPLGAWAVNFQTGEIIDGYRTNSFVVRLVRMGQTSGLLSEDRPSVTYMDHGNGTVSHIPTGLMWQKCPISFKWSSNSCDGIGNIYPWNEAIGLTSIFGEYTDWRLPTEDELISLIDYTKISPSINSVIFPNIPYTFGCEFYWSKSTLAGSTNSAWKISMKNGRVQFIGTSVNNCVLLVRKG